MTGLKIIFMGTPEFSLPVLKSLIKAGHDIVAVYTQPPRPAGRGHKIRLSAIHKYAKYNNLTVFTPKNFKSEQDKKEFQNLNADIAIVVAYGLILPEDILTSPQYGCLNIHASLLPRWRGAAPIQRAIIAGDKETGVCIMQMEKGLDTGPVILRNKTPITEQITASILHDKLSNMGAEMIVNVLDLYKNNNLPKAKTQTGETCYAHMLKKDEGKINWHDSAENIERKIRALTPWPGIWCTYNNEKKRLKIHSAKIIVIEKNINPATIINKNLTISCGKNALCLIDVQPEGKKTMSGQDFLNGHSCEIGNILL